MIFPLEIFIEIAKRGDIIVIYLLRCTCKCLFALIKHNKICDGIPLEIIVKSRIISKAGTYYYNVTKNYQPLLIIKLPKMSYTIKETYFGKLFLCCKLDDELLKKSQMIFGVICHVISIPDDKKYLYQRLANYKGEVSFIVKSKFKRGEYEFNFLLV
jgi:hypothetical protein